MFLEFNKEHIFYSVKKKNKKKTTRKMEHFIWEL